LKKIFIIFIFFLAIPILADINHIFIFMKNKILTSNFCDYRNDHFHTGIDLAALDEDIIVPNDSEVVFFNIKRKNSINYGNGNFVILQDNKNNYRFNFSHLKDDSFDNKKIVYSRGDKIAVSGNTGHSSGSHLHLEIEDIKNKLLLNPLTFLNIEDTRRPRLIDIYFITEDNKKISITDPRNYKIEKNGKLFIKCMDYVNNSEYALVPYKITVYIDGKKTSSLMFDHLTSNLNNFVLNDGRDFSSLYINNEKNDFFISNFFSLPGLIGFKVEIEDFSGNILVYKKNLIVEYKKENEDAKIK